MQKKPLFGFGRTSRKLIASATALAMAATMCAGVPAAFAAQKANPVSTTEAVTAAASPAAQTAVQMLGMSCIDEVTYDDGEWGDLSDWGSYLKYIIEGSDEYSVSPDPLIKATLAGDTANGKVQLNGARTTVTTVSRPKAALKEYGSGDALADATWERLPDILTGSWVSNGVATNYKDELNNSVNLITGKETKDGVNPVAGAENYDPKVLSYNPDTFATIIDSTYEMAKAAKEVVDESNGTKMLRFGNSNSAFEIATDFEKFVKGSQGYVLYRLEKAGKQKKTVAVLSGMEEAGSQVVFKTLSAEAENTTAGSYRAVEAVKNICTVVTGTDQQITLDELAKVDFIVIPADVKTANAMAEKLGSLKEKTYWVSSSAASGQGTIYDINRNNTEVGQNYARLIGCVYPEYIDQSDMVAYWYKNFLHVKSSQLGTVIEKAMSGTRNWDSATSGNDYNTWTAKTVADFDEADVKARINTGMAYLLSQNDSWFEGNNKGFELLKPTSYMSSLGTATSVKSVTATSKGFTVKYAKSSKATGYQVCYSTKKNFSGAKTKTVTGAKSTTYKATKLKAKTTYYVKVRSYTTVSGTKQYTEWSAAKKVKTKK